MQFRIFLETGLLCRAVDKGMAILIVDGAGRGASVIAVACDFRFDQRLTLTRKDPSSCPF
ncbi:hypothetical protein [Rhodobacter sp. SY28-1]|uniref:hypothetical protein n=1 Tax=Rhodobacter sp. SY28-1 TaxID=2562317 RepID=UPI001485B922|nr:hypothetical protein [Rhodobacter sp. SY28-1]